MPSLSPTMTEGTIVEWYKEEGDAVALHVLQEKARDRSDLNYALCDEALELWGARLSVFYKALRPWEAPLWYSKRL